MLEWKEVKRKKQKQKTNQQLKQKKTEKRRKIVNRLLIHITLLIGFVKKKKGCKLIIIVKD